MRFQRSGKRTTEMLGKCHRNATQGWQGICLLPAASGAINVCTLLQVQVKVPGAGENLREMREKGPNETRDKLKVACSLSLTFA